MATDWEVGPKDWEQDVCFRLWDQTKEVVQGKLQSLYFTQQTPRHRPVLQSPSPELSLEADGEDTWSQCWPGQGRRRLSTSTHQPHTGCQHSPPWDVAPPANTAAGQAVLWAQLTPAQLPLLLRAQPGHVDESLPSTTRPVLSHRENFQTPHSTANQAQLPCDRHTQLWWGSYSLSIMNSSCQEERRNKTQLIF